ncbi:twin-arginine translocation signal domain-containing protein [Hymenobacter busanensis]|uniref:Twin-arginine translocation signal domain-containing protein n=1 Tax=Hymenobacter busanensis TaxID=2607656 RepID=A0A7L5A3T4_9BACT|nr:metallophosphatase [Hymenobacter busanensis]KAA9338324.1 twin-arginine translocation signal domain-containing protein [Hymenobacter busanensis]QHJ09252.1 twin-arginine translocation signal domain-containing protein [Hymenobacter busanensis]
MNRRDFIKSSALTTAGLGLLGPGVLSAAGSAVHLTILHTNDMHSRIDPFPVNSAQWADQGGMARRAALVQSIRKEQPNVLLLDAGDIWQGTPYFNFFGGELEYKLMSQMGYDAATLGNHDFDNGLEGLQKQLPNAQFPFIIANYDFSQTPLKGRFQPYKVFEKQGVRIGVFGVGIEMAGLIADKNFGATKYLDPIAVAKEQVQHLRGPEKCDLVICLSHLGYKYESAKVDDHKLAAAVPGIDLILGGHTHTFLDTPTVVEGAQGHRTLVNQVGWSGIKLGRIDYSFDRATRKMGVAAAGALSINASALG